MADGYKNFAFSKVATAPSPAASGTSLIVTAAEGTRFPAVPFNASIFPAGEVPTPANAEVVRVTVIATDTFTIARTQEGSSARTIVVGDQIIAGISVKMLDDIFNPTQLNFLAATPTTPAANSVGLFGRKVAGKMLPAFIGPSGLDSAIQASFARNKVAQFSALPGSAALTTATGMALTATGTATIKNPASTNLYTQTKGVEALVTVAATTAVAGFRSTIAAYWRGSRVGEGGFFFVCRFGLATGVATSTRRAFVGLMASTAAPTDVNPSTNVNMCGMGLDTGDANWSFMHNDAVGAATKIDLGVGFAKATADRTGVYEIAMFCAPNGTEIFYECTDQVDGSVVTGSVTTDLPVNTTFLTQKMYASVGGTSSVIGIMLSSLYIETDL